MGHGTGFRECPGSWEGEHIITARASRPHCIVQHIGTWGATRTYDLYAAQRGQLTSLTTQRTARHTQLTRIDGLHDQQHKRHGQASERGFLLVEAFFFFFSSGFHLAQSELFQRGNRHPAGGQISHAALPVEGIFCTCITWSSHKGGGGVLFTITSLHRYRCIFSCWVGGTLNRWFKKKCISDSNIHFVQSLFVWLLRSQPDEGFIANG